MSKRITAKTIHSANGWSVKVFSDGMHSYLQIMDDHGAVIVSLAAVRLSNLAAAVRVAQAEDLLAEIAEGAKE